MSIGERIKAEREKKNLTQEQLGAMINVSGVTIMRYEKGRQPSLKKVKLLASALDVPSAYLLGFASRDGHEIDEVLGYLTFQKYGYSPADSTRMVDSEVIAVSEGTIQEDRPFISERIKQRRAELSLSLKDIALATGLDERTVLSWEQGDVKHLRIDEIVLVARALKTSPDFLIGRFDNPNSPPVNLPSLEIDTGEAHICTTAPINEALAEIAEAELLGVERSICGYDKELPDYEKYCYWNQDRIRVITEFIKRNSEMLKIQMDSQTKGHIEKPSDSSRKDG